MKKGNSVKNKLKHYSAFSVAFLAMQQTAGAQVVYTDIAPDIVLDERTEGFWVDIDDNGTLDFAFINSSFTFFSYDFASYHTVQDLLAGPYISQNSLAAKAIDFSSYSAFFPYAIEQESKIGSSLSWQTWGIQVLALRIFYHYGEDILDHCLNCYWYNDTVPEILDHYIGIRFIDDDVQNHYGWIRCDVKDEGRTLVIKDYAYELQPDNPIFAGDTVHYNIAQGHLGANGIYMYSFNNTIYINTTETFGTELSITVFDITGREIKKAESNLQHTEILLDVTDGIYVVEITAEGNKFVKKVFLK